MQALILAAGRGSRLSNCVRGKPKCLIEVGGKPLIDHQLNVLRSVGITRICVVTGYCAEQVSCFVARRGQCIENPDYAKTNSVYSLSLARGWVTGPFVMLNSDVLAHPEVYQRVMSAEESDGEDIGILHFDRKSASFAGRREEPRMIQGNPTTVLFTGYAPVHFICFRPLYERLDRHTGGRARDCLKHEACYDKEGWRTAIGWRHRKPPPERGG